MFCFFLKGAIESAFDIMKILLFKRNYRVAFAQAPNANRQSFVNLVSALRKAVEMHQLTINNVKGSYGLLTQEQVAQKSVWILKNMTKCKIGGFYHDIYQQLYEIVGVAWWEHLPRHLTNKFKVPTPDTKN